MKIDDKLVLVTGGGSGIGLATAEVLVREGARVVICGRNQAKLNAVQQCTPEISVYACDIRNAQQRHHMIEYLHDEHGPLDILINNAGIQINSDVRELGIHIQSEITTNLTAPIELFSKFAVDLLRGCDTAVVNVCSLLGYVPRAESMVYSVSKAGLSTFSQSLRIAAKGSAMRVVEVIPPLVDTELTKSNLGKKVSPSIVAEAILDGLRSDKRRIDIGVSSLAMKLNSFLPQLISKMVNRQPIFYE